MLPSTLATKNVSLDLGYFKHFRSKHFELLANRSLFVEVIRQLSYLLLIMQVICLKYLWKSEAVAQQSSVKMGFFIS